MAPAVPTYAPRDPSSTVLSHVIAEHLETFLASCHDDPEATGFPAYVEREFGLDHRVGHLVSMTTEKTPDSIQRGIATRELPRHP